MAIAAHAVDRAGITDGADALVIGTGGIGGFIVYAAARAGARILACESDGPRRALAADLGAAEVFAAPDDGGTLPGADIVFEVSGTPAGLATALRSVRRGGRVIAVGLQAPPSAVDLRALSLDEVELIGTAAHRCATDLPAALRLLADRPDGWSDIASTAIPLEAVVNDGLDPLWNRTSRQIKTLIDPRIAVARPTEMAPATVSAG
jgi:(R,R)-butanediol dehydrogenase/meso-butanediol dehydrogenase/diacetyl reductase